ncbi:MAG: hypothetical protein MK066_05720 [Crocinitomicaceae bacterium]|nr:hypothetical protein [Crocinitomicaceae bacterium]
MKFFALIAIVSAFLLFVRCSEEVKEEVGMVSSKGDVLPVAELTELSDSEYPDNPDVLVRHSKYVDTEMDKIEFLRKGKLFDIIAYPINAKDDTVILSDISLSEFMPTIPRYAREDEYMSLVSIVNQEWNRNQVKWDGEDLVAVTHKQLVVNGELVTRVDIARNCLNAYLWEFFLYAEEDGKNKAFYHGWFDFPRELYRQLYEERNDIKFEKYAKYLENWVDPPSEKLDINLIRNELTKSEVSFVNHDDEMYPLTGERKKKKIEVIYPESYDKMSDFHTDSALFATFSPPGFYNRAQPRTTELGRFTKLTSVEYLKTVTRDKRKSDELRFVFERENGEQTYFVFGGIDFESLPILSVDEANAGQQFSMGIGNHPFYEGCTEHDSLCSMDNPYFGVLLDQDGRWLDSHKVGIDGPLIHKDQEGKVHVWLLSFERHALVGHYELNLLN